MYDCCIVRFDRCLLNRCIDPNRRIVTLLEFTPSLWEILPDLLTIRSPVISWPDRVDLRAIEKVSCDLRAQSLLPGQRASWRKRSDGDPLFENGRNLERPQRAGKEAISLIRICRLYWLFPSFQYYGPFCVDAQHKIHSTKRGRVQIACVRVCVCKYLCNSVFCIVQFRKAISSLVYVTALPLCHHFNNFNISTDHTALTCEGFGSRKQNTDTRSEGSTGFIEGYWGSGCTGKDYGSMRTVGAGTRTLQTGWDVDLEHRVQLG